MPSKAIYSENIGILQGKVNVEYKMSTIYDQKKNLHKMQVIYIIWLQNKDATLMFVRDFKFCQKLHTNKSK